MSAYFFTCLFAYFLGLSVFVWQVRLFRFKIRDLVPCLIVGSFGMVFGAKLFHVLFESRGHRLSTGLIAQNALELLKDDPWHGFRFLDPGYVLYGGIIFGVLAGYACLKFQKQNNLDLLGVSVAKAAAVGLFMGRLGCFWTGCCYGIANIPVQLFEAFYFLWLFFQVEGLKDLFIRYACWRFGLEFMRADEGRGIWALGLSTSQWVSLGIITIWTGCGLTERLKSSQIRATRIQI